jgi:glycosyltransferase involved in cell wall biosynthesis
VLVVDDGSRDQSVDLVQAMGVEVLQHPRRRGVGAAVRTGLGEAARRGAWAAVFLDADGEYDPTELEELLRPIAEGSSDYVVGSRFAGTIHSMSRPRRFGNRVLTRATALLAHVPLTDGQSGFRALSANALAVVDIVHDYNYAQVLTLDLLGKGLRYAEQPITYRRRRAGRSFVRPVPYLLHVVPAVASVSWRRWRLGLSGTRHNRAAPRPVVPG